MSRFNKAIGSILGGVVGLVVGSLISVGLMDESTADQIVESSAPIIEYVSMLLGSTFGTYVAAKNTE